VESTSLRNFSYLVFLPRNPAVFSPSPCRSFRALFDSVVEDKNMKTTLNNFVCEQNYGLQRSLASVKKIHTRNPVRLIQPIRSIKNRRGRGGRSQSLRFKLIRETERFLSDPQSRPWALAEVKLGLEFLNVES